MYRFLRFLLIVFVLSITLFTASAETEDVFADGVVLSQEEQRELLEYCQFRPLAMEPKKDVFRHFDVNSDGTVALVYDSVRRRHPDIIVVYSPDGVFQYGYQLNQTGYIGVVWKGEQLYIANSRNSFLVNDQKQCVEIKEIPESNEWSPFSSATTTKTVNGCIYQASEKVEFDNYSVLTKMDSVGEKVIFKSSNEVVRQKNNENIYEILTFVVLIIGVCLAIVYTVRKNISKYQSNQNR